MKYLLLSLISLFFIDIAPLNAQSEDDEFKPRCVSNEQPYVLSLPDLGLALNIPGGVDVADPSFRDHTQTAVFMYQQKCEYWLLKTYQKMGWNFIRLSRSEDRDHPLIIGINKYSKSLNDFLEKKPEKKIHGFLEKKLKANRKNTLLKPIETQIGKSFSYIMPDGYDFDGMDENPYVKKMQLKQLEMSRDDPYVDSLYQMAIEEERLRKERVSVYHTFFYKGNQIQFYYQETDNKEREALYQSIIKTLHAENRDQSFEIKSGKLEVDTRISYPEVGLSLQMPKGWSFALSGSSIDEPEPNLKEIKNRASDINRLKSVGSVFSYDDAQIETKIYVRNNVESDFIVESEYKMTKYEVRQLRADNDSTKVNFYLKKSWGVNDFTVFFNRDIYTIRVDFTDLRNYDIDQLRSVLESISLDDKPFLKREDILSLLEYITFQNENPEIGTVDAEVVGDDYTLVEEKNSYPVSENEPLRATFDEVAILMPDLKDKSKLNLKDLGVSFYIPGKLSDYEIVENTSKASFSEDGLVEHIKSENPTSFNLRRNDGLIDLRIESVIDTLDIVDELVYERSQLQEEGICGVFYSLLLRDESFEWGIIFMECEDKIRTKAFTTVDGYRLSINLYDQVFDEGIYERLAFLRTLQLTDTLIVE